MFISGTHLIIISDEFLSKRSVLLYMRMLVFQDLEQHWIHGLNRGIDLTRIIIASPPVASALKRERLSLISKRFPLMNNISYCTQNICDVIFHIVIRVMKAGKDNIELFDNYYGLAKYH